MRALILNDEVTQRIKVQVEWAERPENHYYPERDKEPPGDNPAFVMMLEVGFRVVYSHTVSRGRGEHFRHLSISVEGNKYPNEVAAFTIATLFGFTGGVVRGDSTIKPGDDWRLHVDKEARVIVFAQEIKP